MVLIPIFSTIDSIFFIKIIGSSTVRWEYPDIGFWYTRSNSIARPIGVFTFKMSLLFWRNTKPFFLSQTNKRVSHRLVHSVQLIVVAFVSIVIVGFAKRSILTTACDHPLVRSLIGHGATKTRTFVQFTDGELLEQFVIYVITGLWCVTVSMCVCQHVYACVCLCVYVNKQGRKQEIRTSDMLMSRFRRPSNHLVNSNLRSSCLRRNPEEKRPRRSG